ncbi:MAG: bifunctional phosphoribosylaminoimidazolecarboxamide formyltransferase/inosine monophosphate cyclohydrolase [Dehalococcoidia bacterium]|nr:bifunctional phosphoribosylaminoimidazolecarboxamide formyltransferase/inosine monophosphate cyclohydrolase [Dehalococcoidia bacterium]
MRALISVSDKSNLEFLAKEFIDLDIEIISTGGTADYLRELGVSVVDVSTVTGFPEILDGRVKTLNPFIHGGLLAKKSDPNHINQIEEYSIKKIDIVINNLYPFNKTISKQNVSINEALENIDIGGPAMTRAAAKNFEDVLIVVDPKDYKNFIEQIKQENINLDYRKYLASKAFQHTAAYDANIASFLSDEKLIYPNELSMTWKKISETRYGENPHQKSAVYSNINEVHGIVNSKLIHGLDMSYLNYFDADAAWDIVNQFSEHCVAIIKHANPCGLSTNKNQTKAYKNAFSGDTISAFGGIVGFNSKVTYETALEMKGILYDVIVAPDYEKPALELLRQRKRTRILQVSKTLNNTLQIRNISGGVIIQEKDNKFDSYDKWQCVTKEKPSKKEILDMEFAWKACKYIHSNAIVFAKDQMIKGMGAGQPNRAISVYLAGKNLIHTANKNFVMASDAFFPFPDGIELAHKYGASIIIQPGGSINDKKVIECADNLGIIMMFTNRRHFLH